MKSSLHAARPATTPSCPCCARCACCAEVEREKECVCIVSHQAVLRALYGYFMNQPLEVGGGL